MPTPEPGGRLLLLSPLAGWSTPLDEIPDPVFAGRMLGEGVAVDPTSGTLHAPCDGEIIALPQTRHALTLRSDAGAEILMHIGIDTVALAGEGFEAHVMPGRRVAAGERLITFDLDLIARRAKSLLTPVLLVEGCGFAVVRSSEGREIAAGEVLMEIAPLAESAASDGTLAPARGEEGGATRRVRIALEHGIHARPAAQIVRALKGTTGSITVALRGRTANARSTVALMKLGARKGDEIALHAAGSDAAAAIDAIAAVLAGAHGMAGGPPRAARVAVPSLAANPSARAPQEDSSARVAHPGGVKAAVETGPGASLPGVIASRGLAVGQAVRLEARELEVTPVGAGIGEETRRLELARAAVRARLQAVGACAAAAAREIVAAHLELLDDPELIEKSLALIAAGASAGHAWRQAIRADIEALRALGDPRMAERVDDLIDLERQVLLSMSADAGAATRELPADAIVLAEELLPSQLVGLDATRLAGICLAAGGATSHVSILAAAMGIPALVAIGPALRRIDTGTALLLDADAGLLHVDPGAQRLAGARRQLALRTARRAAERDAARRDCYTADGVRIAVLANIGSLADARAAASNGAEGCGLLRTEFLFLERETPPGEAEQHAEYQRLAEALPGKPLTVRTLDVGGDKPIPYLPLPAEQNPALGLRGVRTSLWRPELLRQQLRAILGVRPHGQCRILLPMITDVAEIRCVRAMVEEMRADIGRREPIELGVMIETPASALLADALAAEADFFSIGTNDLSQYTLAMDRGHPELAGRLDALHPAVLRLIERTAQAARSRQRGVAVCGGLASEPVAAPLLIGLGVHELSAVPAVIPHLKALIAGLALAECTAVARQALEQSSAAEVRALGLRLLARESEPEPV